jgi:hypothetical protein
MYNVTQKLEIFALTTQHYSRGEGKGKGKGKVKVKVTLRFTLEQAMKSHTGSRGIALLFF